MDYERLLKGVEYYNKHYPHWDKSYRKLRTRGDDFWLHLEMLDKQRIRSEVIGFLNNWLCRVDYRSIESLNEVLNKLPPLYAALKNESIESVEFYKKRLVGNNLKSTSEIIEEIMQNFLNVKPKFGSVAASKLMHMAIPKLFVMWDTGIKSKYHLSSYYSASQARNYVKFLKLIQLQSLHAIKSYAQSKKVAIQTAIQHIMAKDDNSTLARMIDKYNFALRDGKVDLCLECYKNWQRLT